MQEFHGHEHDGFFASWLEQTLEGTGMAHEGVHFITEFVVDSINIFLILFVVMSVVSFLQTYLNFDKMQKKLVGLNSVWGYALALVLGTLSPFCSCTIIPVVIGLLNMGVPVGVCICFLTSASMLNLTALIALFSATNLSFFLTYLGISIVMVIVSSVVMSAFFKVGDAKLYHVNVEELEEQHHHHEHHHHDHHGKSNPDTLRGRIRCALHSTGEVLSSSWIFILIGVALSAAMAAFVPVEQATAFVTDNSFLSMLVASVIGLPIHSDMFTILPLIGIFRMLSVPVALIFIVATMMISIPEIVLLSRAFKAKFIAVYTGVLFALTLILGSILVLVS